MACWRGAGLLVGRRCRIVRMPGSPAVSVSQAVVSLSAEQGQVLGLLLPCLSGMAVDRAEVSGDLVRIWVHAVAGGAACPDCGTWCTAVRDRYARRLRDAAAGGRRVLIWLVVRLLRCGNAQCPRASFAEQPQGLAVPYARRTPLLAGQPVAVGPLRVFRTAKLLLIHAASCRFRYSSWTSCGVL